MRSRVKKVVASVVTIFTVTVLVIGAGWAFMHQKQIRDFFMARDFKPSTEIAEVLERISLTEAGERIFRATHPTVEDRADFNASCRRADHADSGHLLGCYVDGRIHLFSVVDERLNGVVEVTAVHELLHAAYERLGQRDRDALAKRLTSLFHERAAEDPSFAERMKVYENLSASRFANELHSIFATEVVDLPQWLETHYATWIADRSVTIQYFHSYRDVFDDIRSEAELLEQELRKQLDWIEKEAADYGTAVQSFNDDWADFAKRYAAQEFSDDPEEATHVRQLFGERRDRLEVWRTNIEQEFAEYDVLRSRLSALGDLSVELNDQIDSKLPNLSN